MPKENAVWKKVARLLPATRIDSMRVENWVTPGTPDVNLCWMGREIWIETKIASKTGRVKFRKGQLPWIFRRVNAGGHVFILVQWKTELLLYSGSDAQLIFEKGLAHATLWPISATPKSIAMFLTSPWGQ